MTPSVLAAFAAALLLCAPALASDNAAARQALSHAQDQYRRAEFKESLKTVEDVLAQDSRNGRAYELRARLWHVLGNGVKQKKDAEKALGLLGGGKLDGEALIAQGGAYLLDGRLDKALASLNDAVKITSASPEALAARARVWRELGELAKAKADLDAALKGRARVPAWLYVRARVHYEAGEDAAAIADLTDALRGNKGFAAAYALIGAALAHKGDFVRAAKAYDRALALDPQYVFAYLGRAAVRLRRGDEAGASKDYEEAIRANALDYSPYFNRAEMHWRAGRREAALADERRALGAATLTGPAAVSIGDRYLSEQLWREALDAYTRGVELGAESAALPRRAKTWEALKDLKKALADLDAALKVTPDSATTLAARGTLKAKMGRDKDALEDFTRASRLASKDPGVLVACASFLASRGKSELALADFDTALSVDPDNAEAHNGRGVLRANAFGDYANALPDVNKAVELAPRDAGYRFNLGMLLIRSRRYASAIDSFNASLALKGPAARILEKRAEAKFLRGDHTGARLDIESAIEKDPKNPSIYDTLGHMRLRARDYEQAVRDLSQALHLDSDYAPAHIHRGLAFASLGETGSAVSDLKRAIALDARSKEAWTDLCQAERLDQDLKASVSACEQAIALDSGYGPAYLQRGLSLLALKQYPRATADIDSAWRLGTRRAQGLIAKATALALQGQYSEAHRCYLQAYDADPSVKSAYMGFVPGHPAGDDFLSTVMGLDAAFTLNARDPYAFVLRGDALHNAEQFDKAVLDYTKALELDAAATGAYIGRGLALIAQDALDAAQQDFSRAIELAPDDVDPHVRLAVAETMARAYPAALTELAKALKLDPKNAEAYLRAGNVHYFEKDFEKALADYRLAAQVDPLDARAYVGLGLGRFAQQQYDEALDSFSLAIALDPTSDRPYRNRASVWIALKKFGNAAADLRTASLVNTNPALVEEYRKMIQAAESRAADGGKSS